MNFRTRFSPQLDTGLTCEGGLTDQAPLAECDLNGILKRYKATGIMPQDPGTGRYVDTTERPADLLDAFERLNAAEEYFAGLPSSVRESFGNDFRNAIALASSDPMKAVELGLAGLLPKAPQAIVESAPKSATPTDPADQAKKEASPKGVESPLQPAGA